MTALENQKEQFFRVLFGRVKACMGPAGVNLVCVVCLIYIQARSEVFVRVCRELASIDPMWRSRFWIVYANEKFNSQYSIKASSDMQACHAQLQL